MHCVLCPASASRSFLLLVCPKPDDRTKLPLGSTWRYILTAARGVTIVCFSSYCLKEGSQLHDVYVTLYLCMEQLKSSTPVLVR